MPSKGDDIVLVPDQDSIDRQEFVVRMVVNGRS